MAGILYSEVWFWPYPVPAMLCPREWGLMHQGAAAAIAAGECSACTCCTFLLERRVMMMMMMVPCAYPYLSSLLHYQDASRAWL